MSRNKILLRAEKEISEELKKKLEEENPRYGCINAFEIYILKQENQLGNIGKIHNLYTYIQGISGHIIRETEKELVRSFNNCNIDKLKEYFIQKGFKVF